MFNYTINALSEILLKGFADNNKGEDDAPSEEVDDVRDDEDADPIQNLELEDKKSKKTWIHSLFEGGLSNETRCNILPKRNPSVTFRSVG